MVETANRKIFAGPRIRRLRRELKLGQAQMAAALGFSASYLNLVERNQRPVSAQLLLKLAEVYEVDLAGFAGSDEARAFADLTEILADPVFAGLDIARADMQDLADASPAMITAFRQLYTGYQEAKDAATKMGSRIAEGGSVEASLNQPVDAVRDFIHSHRNYFADVDEAAEALATDLRLERDDPGAVLSGHLEGEHGISVRVMPSGVMGESLRHFDYHRRQLHLSELLDLRTRLFQMAYQIAQFEARDIIQRAGDRYDWPTEEARRLARVSLSNYFAGALLMPYSRFLGEARHLRYDIEHLGQRFGTSFEQVCHRLTTLQRPGQRGVPFFFVRVDKAGNISKRFSAGRFHFSHQGGTCPLWHVHDAFTTPGRLSTQIVRLPDDTTYFSVARTVRRVGTTFGLPDQPQAIALGCDIAHAGELIYARDYDLHALNPVAIGPNCRLCERPACPARAHPPITRRLLTDEGSRGLAAYRFTADDVGAAS